MKKEISKLACAYSKTTNLTGSILSELNQELGEVQVAVLQNRATIDYLLLKEHMVCEHFPGRSCFNLSDFSQTIQIQLDNIHLIIDKFSQMPRVPNWFSWFHLDMAGNCRSAFVMYSYSYSVNVCTQFN